MSFRVSREAVAVKTNIWGQLMTKFDFSYAIELSSTNAMTPLLLSLCSLHLNYSCTANSPLLCINVKSSTEVNETHSNML